MKNKELFLTTNSIANEFIKSYEYPYEVLPNIKSFIKKIGKTLNNNYKHIDKDIWIHKNANISKTAEIHGPCIIDDATEIRCNAFIRGNVIIGKNCVIGNSCEIKNSILYNNVQIPHFNYVGDSILGNHTHMGAGSIISNLKNNKKNIVIHYKGKKIETGLKKVGAFLGDNVEIGCGSILNPGTIIMPNTNIYPLTNVRGVIEKNKIVKSMDNIVEKN